MAERFPWEAAMAFGLGVLRLAPREFWAMTPRELASAMRACGHGLHAPPGRAEMEALMRAFPDPPRTMPARETPGHRRD
ncbi:rcc01693 family protein [Oricola thermophila]|uniref:Phage tail assembly chaperone n=1 Tax=Oricola thermophila TaxID=2742145 RepID=A0A6N1VHJ5_9HYPH|nr:rcc01693 family protein [Oricola thermophila]QKV18629.1 phage tail assembly chaperone [Oricola thermophila]